jgi:hypothetical protein
MPERPRFTSHEDYFAAMPGEVRDVLLKVRAVVEASLPKAERCISYNLPAYRAGKVFFYFAGFKHHLASAGWRVLSVIPPMTQISRPTCPSHPPPTSPGFLRSRGVAAFQEDLALALVLRLFSPAGLEAMRARHGSSRRPARTAG